MADKLIFTTNLMTLNADFKAKGKALDGCVNLD